MNEDALFVSGTTFGVFDGATSLNPFVNTSGETGGYLASNIASQVFQRPSNSLKKQAEIANRAIARSMENYQINTRLKQNLWCTSAAAVRIEHQQMEWVQTGDSDIILIHSDHSYHVLVDIPNHDYQTLSQWKSLDKTNRGTIFEELKEQIIAVRNGMNVTYGVLNGEQAAMNLLKSGKESLENVKHILLFTDGLKIPAEDVSPENNYDELVDIFLNRGLNGLRHHVRQLEQTDPDCFMFPRFKTHDDIAAISIRL